MNFSFGFNSIVTVTGLTKPSDTSENQKSWTTGTKVTDLNCYIEQIDPKTAAIFDAETAFKRFLMITDGVFDIDEGDKVTDNHGRSFVVAAVQKFSENPDVPNHLEVHMVKRYPDN
jgi:hypothetical protein